MNQEDFKPTMPPQILFLVEIWDYFLILVTG
jgi:hypothetical protein